MLTREEAEKELIACYIPTLLIGGSEGYQVGPVREYWLCPKNHEHSLKIEAINCLLAYEAES